MHELSIASCIIDMAQEEAARRSVRVVAIHLELGALSGVVKEALAGSYEIAVVGTALEGARLVIVEKSVVVFCPACRSSHELPSIQWFRCPVCDGPAGEVLDGDQLRVTALEVAS
jgi:hydrogenase nickel incorporation protein HypA/HybF